MAKRNCKQESQAIKAMKQCGPGIGAVVTLKVDFRTHSHTQGPIAIVYEMKESTGGILVCCEHGVITHDGSRKDYWVPYDKYTVNARVQDTCPIEEALQSVRNFVLEGRYNSTDQRRISWHELLSKPTPPPFFKPSNLPSRPLGRTRKEDKGQN